MPLPYLSFEEYQTLGIAEVTAEEYPKILQKASDAVDTVTRAFYQFNDLETDHEFRKQQFKKAVAAQIDYFADNGASSAHRLNTPLSITIGRTQISNGANNQQSINRILAEEVTKYLQPTGLLYRGL